MNQRKITLGCFYREMERKVQHMCGCALCWPLKQYERSISFAVQAIARRKSKTKVCNIKMKNSCYLFESWFSASYIIFFAPICYFLFYSNRWSFANCVTSKVDSCISRAYVFFIFFDSFFLCFSSSSTSPCNSAKWVNCF